MSKQYEHATPGPWKFVAGDGIYVPHIEADGLCIATASSTPREVKEANIELIAASVNAIRKLAAELKTDEAGAMEFLEFCVSRWGRDEEWVNHKKEPVKA